MPNPSTYRRAPALVPLVAATACWGAGTVVTKQVLDDVAPLTLLPMQLTASCILLLLLCLVRRERLTWSSGTRRLAALGVLNPGLAYALGLLGLVSITASMSVLLWAAEPVFIVLLAVVLLREQVPARLLAALAAAVAGVVLVVYQPGVGGTVVGVVLTLTAVGCCALYTVATRQLLLDDASLPVVLAQQVVALTFAVLLVTSVHLAGGQGWSLAGHPRHVGSRRSVGLPLLRPRVLVLPRRSAPRRRIGCRGLPATHPGVRRLRRLPGRRTPRPAPVGGSGRRSRCHRSDGAPADTESSGSTLSADSSSIYDL